MSKQKKPEQIRNSKVHDSSSKLIFGNAELCSQFLRNYMDMPILKNIRAEEFRELDIPKDYLNELSEHGTEELLNIIEKVITVMLRHLKVPEEEVAAFTEQVKERKMGELFEHFKGYDVPATRVEARELLLIEMVCKKIKKGKTIVQVAEDLETERPVIEKIYKVAQAFAPDYDIEKIQEAMKNK